MMMMMMDVMRTLAFAGDSMAQRAERVEGRGRWKKEKKKAVKIRMHARTSIGEMEVDSFSIST